MRITQKQVRLGQGVEKNGPCSRISDQDFHLRKKAEWKVMEMEETFKWLTSMIRRNKGKHTHIKEKGKKSLQERLKWAAKKKIK